jgi:hypothetical protein
MSDKAALLAVSVNELRKMVRQRGISYNGKNKHQLADDIIDYDITRNHAASA